MGIFSKLFQDKKDLQASSHDILNLMVPFFSDQVSPRLNDTFMSCVQAHARHISKIKPTVFLKDVESTTRAGLNRLLQLRPNPTMNASQFWEKVAYGYFVECNAFIYLDYDWTNFKEPLRSLWVLDPTSIEVRMDEAKRIFLRFTLQSETVETSVDNIVHIARNMNSAEFFGEKNEAIKKVLDVMNTNYEGVVNAVKTSAFIRFLVRNGTLMTEPAKKQRTEAFANMFLGVKSSYGIAYIDGAEEITPIESKAKYANADEMAHFEKKIYNYLGISEKIVQTTYTEDEWNAYYESSIEPFVIQLQDELTYKIFTQREIEVGNRIEIDDKRLQSASLKTRIQIAAAILKLPVFKPNDVLKLLYMPAIEHGDKEYATLNYVDANKQNQYQGTEPKGSKTDPKEDPKNDPKQDQESEGENE
jgi:HK97 family phage portal protein